jgi:hypothetical protein
MSMKSIRGHDTEAWYAYTWISFSLSLLTTLLGIYYMPIDFWIKGFMMMGLFFTVGSTFTLAKTIRDRHESRRDSELMTLFDQRLP